MNENDTPDDNWTAAPLPDGPRATPPPARRAPLLRRRAASIAAFTGLAIGGVAGGVVISQAATASPSPTASGSPSTMTPGDGRRGPGGPHGLQSEDLGVVAGVIGVSTSDLQTALGNGQTIAAVAKAHNVDANKVISAWVASENQEIDARASSGQITSAQATQMKAHTQQRITDEVNGVRPAGGPGDGHGPGGPGGPWGGFGPGAPGSGSGTTQSSTGTSA